MEKYIEIKQTDNGKQSYLFGVYINGHFYDNAYLSYEYPNSTTRKMLVSHNSNIIKDCFDDATQELINFSEFEYRIKKHLAEGKKNLETAKCTVNQIISGNYIPGTAVAIDRYGPIPVYKFPKKFSIQFQDTVIDDVELGIYPIDAFKKDKNSDPHKPDQPLGTRNQFEFIQSLSYDLKIVFYRYLEDLADIFQTITHSDHDTTIGHLKKAEKAISESIETKLRLFDDFKAANRQNTQRNTKATGGLSEFKIKEKEAASKIAGKIISTNSNFFFKLEFYICLSCFIVKELYNIYNIKIESKNNVLNKYNIEDFINKNQRAINAIFEQEVSLDEVFRYLYNRYIDYKSGDINLNSNENYKGKWPSKFALFLNILCRKKKYFYKTARTKIYLSYPFNVPIPEYIQSNFTSIVENSSHNVEIITSKATVGDNLDEVVMTDIWSSDFIFCILPKKLIDVADNERTYGWILKELNHACILNKNIYFLTDHEINIAGVIEDFQNIKVDFLLPQAKNPNKINEIVRILRTQARIIIRQTDLKNIDKNLITDIEKLFQDIHEEKIIEKVERWLKVYDRNLTNNILKINKDTGPY